MNENQPHGRDYLSIVFVDGAFERKEKTVSVQVWKPKLSCIELHSGENERQKEVSKGGNDT